MLEYIFSQLPQEFRGKENWLGVKMSPHSHWTFINRVTEQGIETNEGTKIWDECSQEIISTIFQRLKYEATKIG